MSGVVEHGRLEAGVLRHAARLQQRAERAIGEQDAIFERGEERVFMCGKEYSDHGARLALT